MGPTNVGAGFIQIFILVLVQSLSHVKLFETSWTAPVGQILGKGQEANQVERQMLGIHRIHSDYLLSYFSLSEKVDSVYKKPDFQMKV